jgi:hypothetical protein
LAKAIALSLWFAALHAASSSFEIVEQAFGVLAIAGAACVQTTIAAGSEHRVCHTFSRNVGTR